VRSVSTLFIIAGPKVLEQHEEQRKGNVPWRIEGRPPFDEMHRCVRQSAEEDCADRRPRQCEVAGSRIA